MSMKYKYQSNWSGELQPNLLSVIKTTYHYINNYPFEFKMVSWGYRKQGW